MGHPVLRQTARSISPGDLQDPMMQRLIREESLTVILVEQSARLALEVTERAMVLSRGCVVFSGPSAELLADPKRLANLIVVQ